MKKIAEELVHYEKGLERHPSPDAAGQTALLPRFRALLQDGPASLERGHVPGHLTGSALVTNPALDQVLLTLHAKLGLWLQLGGHADGDADLPRVAMRECEEESGLKRLRFYELENLVGGNAGRVIFDLDIHPIPARKTEPDHLHYDVRYLIVADPSEPLIITPESKELRWFPLSDAYGLTTEPSMHRQFDKLAWVGRRA